LLADAKELEHKLEEGDIGTPTEERPKAKLPVPAVSELPARAVVIALPESPKVPSIIPPSVPSPPSQQQQQLLQKPVKTTARSKRRERSGIPALDKDLPDESETGEDTEAARGFLDDEDDDWDFVEAVDGEDRNGAKGTSLFARGVVDKYRLAVFRKASTPSRSQQSRSVSGASSRNGDGGADGSPTKNRGRAALAFTRKGTRQFLQPKNNASSSGGQSTPTQQQQPPPSAFAYSSKKSMTSFARSPQRPSSMSTLTTNAGSMTPNSTSTMTVSSSMPTNAAGTTTTMGGLLTPSGSEAVLMTTVPSLKNRESAMSVGAKSASSDQSGGGVNGTRVVTVTNGGDLVLEDTNNDQQKVKTAKKLKKYKEGAEKMFSLFSGAASPRQHHHAS
jgi:hypothetical protein